MPDFVCSEPDDLAETGETLGLHALTSEPIPLGTNEHTSVLEFVRQHVLDDPRRLAFVGGPTEISYGELWARAELLAFDLGPPQRRAGLAGVVIACANKEDAVGALLGALMAGWCAIPLHAKSSLETISEELLSEAYAIVHSPSISLSEFQAPHLRRIVMPMYPESKAAQAITNFGSVSGDTPAYILLTSGSTGRPKAVLQNHGGLVGNISLYRSSVRLSANDVVSLIPAYSVDAGIMDIFGALAAGAALAIWETQADGVYGLYEWLTRLKVTLLHATPTVLSLLCAGSAKKNPNSTVTRVVLGGEPLTFARLWPLLSAFSPTTQFINGLGPSECTVACQHFFNRLEAKRSGPCPIGRPVAGVRLFILSSNGAGLELPSQDRPGELVIVSPFLASGYVGDAASTERSFRIFEGVGRAYLTGDFVKLDGSGALVFVGRMDTSKKVAGVFVDVGVIHDRLLQHEDLEWVHVTIRQATDHSGGVLSVAFVLKLGSCDNAIDVELRKLVRDSFPLMPLAVRCIRINSVPLTAGGKVKTEKLEELLVAHHNSYSRSLRELIAEAATFESALRVAWHQLLGVEAMPGSNFYACGGTSLAFMQLIAELTQAFPECFPMSQGLMDPTFDSLRGLQEAFCRSSSAPSADAVPLDGSSYQRALLNHVLLAEPCRSHIMVRAYQMRFSTDIAALRVAIGELFSVSPDWRQIQDDDRVSAACIDWSGAPAGNVVTYATEASSIEDALDSARDLVGSPDTLAAFFIINQGAQSGSVLLFAVSHIYLDGFVFNAVVDRLANAFSRDAVPAGPDKKAGKGVPLRCPVWSESPSSTVANEGRLAATLWWTSKAPMYRPPMMPGETTIPSWHGWADHETSLFHQRLDADTFDFAALSAKYQGSLAQILLACWSWVLCRDTGGAEICFGIPVDVRSLFPGVEETGNYTNVVPCSINVTGHHTLQAYIAHARTRMSESLAHSSLPYPDLDKIFRADQAATSVAYRNRIIYSHLRDTCGRDNSVFGQRLPVHIGYSSCELAINSIEVADGVAIDIEYATSLFSADSLESMWNEFLACLRALAELSPDAPMESLRGWGNVADSVPALAMGPKAPNDATLSLAGLVCQSVKAGRRCTAVVDAAGSHTYDELLRITISFVKLLRKSRTLKPACFVAIALDPPSVGYVGACLACNWLGLVFVPVNAALLKQLPEDWRSRFGISAVISAEGRLSHTDGLGDKPGCDVRLPVSEHAVYAMFTSGSTGSPKLAVNTWNGLLNRFSWMSSTFRLMTPITVQTTVQIYDSSVWQLFWPLTVGGSCVIPRRSGGLLDKAELLSAIDKYHVDIVDFVPSVLGAYLGRDETATEFSDRGRSLKHVIVGGETFSAAQGAILQKALPRASVWNLYGSTEAAIGSVYHRLDSLHTREPIPLGRPIQNTGVCVLNEMGSIVKSGVRGQIALLGTCVGLGYRGDQRLTEIHFVDFHISEVKIPAYLTGDIGSIDATGQLYFHGRSGRVVKLRGQWVGLTALEVFVKRASGESPAYAFVASLTSRPDALIVATESRTSANLLKQVLAKTPGIPILPDLIMNVDAFPIAASGKNDNAALEAECVRRLPSAVIQATVNRGANTILEVMECWRTVLGHDSVALDRTFFELGGNSLLVLQVVELMRVRIDPQLKPLDLFRHSTVRAISILIDQHRQINTKVRLPNA